MFKKILGYFLFVPAFLFSLACLSQLPEVLGNILAMFRSSSDAHAIGYGAGSLVGYLIILLLTYFLWRMAIKLVKKKPPRPETIDDIGKS